MAKKYHLKLKGYVGGWDFDADYVDYYLGKHENEQVEVLINSLGGEVNTALSVSSAFRRHGNVHVHYEGMNASAATIASLGAARVSIDRHAMYLVHKCSQMVFRWDMMNADQLQQLIDECEKTKRDLDKIDLNIASAYAARCRKDKAELLELMKQGGWLSADEALDWGFVDEVTDQPEAEIPHMTEEVKAMMTAEGIPIPTSVEQEDEVEQNLLQRMMTALATMFRRNITNQIEQTMQKFYDNVCRILQCEHLDSEDGKIMLTEEQLQLLEDAIAGDAQQMATLQNELKQRDQDIAQRDQTIAELQKKPADTTAQVINNATADPAVEYGKVLDEARNMFNAIP